MMIGNIQIHYNDGWTDVWNVAGSEDNDNDDVESCQECERTDIYGALFANYVFLHHRRGRSRFRILYTCLELARLLDNLDFM